MQLTRAADYGVRVMIHLASLPKGARVKRDELAEAAGVPESFMSKVLQRLVRARLIFSRRGTQGGFQLGVASENVSLLDVVEAIEGPIELNLCLISKDSCERALWCPAHSVWAEAQAALVNVLKSASLAKLAAEAAARRAMVERHGHDPLSQAHGNQICRDDNWQR
ncbi:MAG: Rrf2 family transcriptional regulator [Acidobacteriota bacterium]|nr:Rrf2 family transcriptional regulator [Blastocatellia bacterium]MDW8239098.1 Rrf2 family transcriptional regulator [Acidobacteriota bacterium]